MKIEALNCPNCGAGALSDSTNCDFCHSRLKTIACPSCFGLIFVGSAHCSHCGKKTVQPEVLEESQAGICPRCKCKLNLLKINEITLRECRKCSGLWSDVETFETICAERENQANVLGFLGNKNAPKDNPVIICAVSDCQTLMNRSNFARSSGVIIDICKKHGFGLMPRIVEVIAFIGKADLIRRGKEKQNWKKREVMVYSVKTIYVIGGLSKINLF